MCTLDDLRHRRFSLRLEPRFSILKSYLGYYLWQKIILYLKEKLFLQGASRAITCVLIAVSLKIFPLLEQAIFFSLSFSWIFFLHEQTILLFGTFYFYGACLLILLPIIMKVMPETKVSAHYTFFVFCWWWNTVRRFTEKLSNLVRGGFPEAFIVEFHVLRLLTFLLQDPSSHFSLSGSGSYRNPSDLQPEATVKRKKHQRDFWEDQQCSFETTISVGDFS